MDESKPQRSILSTIAKVLAVVLAIIVMLGLFFLSWSFIAGLALRHKLEPMWFH